MQGLTAAPRAGYWDLYVILATRLKWTPEQINDLNPDFIEELLSFFAAEQRYEAWSAKEAERKAKLQGRR